MQRDVLGELSCLVRRSRPGAPVLVALHGRGASAEDLADLGDVIDPELAQVYPDAPRPWPARGPVGLCWYDSGPDRKAEIADSRAKLGRTLAAVRTSVSDGPLILLGFSQGALMTMDTGLREGSPARALVALSGYLDEDVGGPASPPLLLVHGTVDDVVPVEKGRDAKARLEARGVRVTYREFHMAHEIRPEVVRAITQFVKEALG